VLQLSDFAAVDRFQSTFGLEATEQLLAVLVIQARKL